MNGIKKKTLISLSSLPDLCNGRAEDTKEMALLHETSHKYAGTFDHAYSVQDCLNLAMTGEAFENANNYAYYTTVKPSIIRKLLIAFYHETLKN